MGSSRLLPLGLGNPAPLPVYATDWVGSGREWQPQWSCWSRGTCHRHVDVASVLSLRQPTGFEMEYAGQPSLQRLLRLRHSSGDAGYVGYAAPSDLQRCYAGLRMRLFQEHRCPTHVMFGVLVTNSRACCSWSLWGVHLSLRGSRRVSLVLCSVVAGSSCMASVSSLLTSLTEAIYVRRRQNSVRHRVPPRMGVYAPGCSCFW
jgi:hypothetical protein